jgi:hypothetical protein
VTALALAEHSRARPASFLSSAGELFGFHFVQASGFGEGVLPEAKAALTPYDNGLGGFQLWFEIIFS